jgi:SAM-dependent methyltransferase
MSVVLLSEPATAENFDEDAYLRANPDVKNAVDAGTCPSARRHFDLFGHKENRWLSWNPDISAARKRKMDRLRRHLRRDMSVTWRNGKADFLTEALRRQTRLAETTNVSNNPYDPEILKLIEKYNDGLLLDCGAGSRRDYYDNVVNFEIVDYPSTDVLGVGEYLPFQDNTFDAIISVAVLEHVADPIKCAAEISRVLKPGGDLFCCIPFLQPLHGYPHHYFNATSQGIRRLFDASLEIQEVTVFPSTHPIHAIQWILGSWANGLTAETRKDFMSMRVEDLLAPPYPLLCLPFARELTMDKQLELACAIVLTAKKPT